MKRFFASLLAVAMFASVAVVFAGCDKADGKTYAFSEYRVTVITAVNNAETDDEKENGIKTTETFSNKEYAALAYKMDRLNKTFKQAKEYTFSSDEQKAFDEAYAIQEKTMKAMKVVFNNGKYQYITFSVDAVTGEGSESIQNGTYTIDKNNIIMRSLVNVDNEDTDYVEYSLEVTAAVLDGKTFTRTEYAGGIDEETINFIDYVVAEDSTNLIEYKSEFIYTQA